MREIIIVDHSEGQKDFPASPQGFVDAINYFKKVNGRKIMHRRYWMNTISDQTYSRMDVERIEKKLHKGNDHDISL